MAVASKGVKNEVIIQAPVELTWFAWTISDRVSQWFAPEAVVEAKVGGAYELYFIPGNREGMNTMGCKIVSLVPQKELSFTWKGPDQFRDIMNQEDELTTVCVHFVSMDEVTTRVTVEHIGFRDESEWKEAVDWHQIAWNGVLSSLKAALEKGEGNLCCQPVND
ncbi:SRPBCC domain-containing protein [Sporosarcina sp. Te-1]|uniref:SRPBCC family protein n=1 Tax=Sporosarcina sp. Te-1 TaxID=2818390 RepID=UPI001A9D92D5|nr:SRPBCC domain-containing protein [Sporosarcina sp. Te-1]QTD40406.1 SRPBCC domain-containing protein [Sporosarcina sp. Te-1]